MSKILVSVVIVTKNRPLKLINCLRALKRSKFAKFEVIIVDQSNTENTFHFSKITDDFMRLIYIKSNRVGKSIGLNIGIKSSSTDLIAFTDDDCIPSVNWLSNIIEILRNNTNIAGIFGKTIPYQPKKHIGLYCPATFKSIVPRSHIINTPCRDWENIGCGNNMAYRRKVFEEIGVFKEWLGPGTFASNGEDSEMALRTLISNKNLYYNPKMIVYHDKWVNSAGRYKQDLLYCRGEVACYGYYAFLGHALGKEIIRDNMKEIFNIDIRQILSNLYHRKSFAFVLLVKWFEKMITRFIGGSIALYYFLSKK